MLSHNFKACDLVTYTLVTTDDDISSPNVGVVLSIDDKPSNPHLKILWLSGPLSETYKMPLTYDADFIERFC